ncbi:MAG: 16S rRNA (cytosine(1402)-N(4))-methyltransferase RsmH [Hellea sp.]|nr:16S rRNA (cytosine(1402)-N(4))-methyltransferase RsmH [Hellea sp.]
MLPEVLAALQPRDGETYIDGTFGNGGYSKAILQAANCNIIALDRDPNVKPRAAELSETYQGRLKLIETPFSNMDEALGEDKVDAVILDIGVSSMQLDQAERGFSFMRAGPLDMRMSQSGPSASDAVNQLREKDLTRIFQVYGEERKARRAAQFIVRAREEGALTTTDQLAGLLEQALGRHSKNHPATRVFQALRIFINDELGELYRGLIAAENILRPGGRLIVVSFHSLEDRLVKKFLRRRSEKPSGGSRYQPEIVTNDFAPSFDLEERSAIFPSDTEISGNARSRSARMRWAVRTEAAMFDDNEDLLPKVPFLSDYKWAS